MTELTKLTIASARDALRKGEISSVELTGAFNAAVDGGDKLNAYAHKTPELAGALRADPRRHRVRAVAQRAQRLGDQVLLDGGLVQLLQQRHRGVRLVAGRRRDDTLQRALRVGVPGPQALRVQHPQPAELADPHRRVRRHHRVGGVGQQRDVEAVGVELPGRRDGLRAAGPPRRDDLDLVEVVGTTGLPAHPDLHEVTHGHHPKRRCSGWCWGPRHYRAA